MFQFVPFFVSSMYHWCNLRIFIAESYFWKYSRNWMKIYDDFLFKKWGRESKGRPWWRPTGQGRPRHAGLRGAAGETRLCPSGTPSGASDAYKIIPDAKTLTPKDFPKYNIELRRHRRQVLGVQKVLFRHPAGTGIGPQSHLHRHRYLRHELWIVPPWTTGL